MSQLIRHAASQLPALVASTGNEAGPRFFEFFVNHIRDPKILGAYTHGEFAMDEQAQVVSPNLGCEAAMLTAPLPACGER